MKKLGIIVVNWNAGMRLLHCIQSVLRSDFNLQNLEVLVIDNLSSDNSLELIENISPILRIIRNNKNLGFGSACNRGLLEVFSEYVLMLNPDVIISPETIKKCVDFLDQNRGIDVLGVKNYDLDGKVAKSCSRFPDTVHFIYDMLGLSKIFPVLFKPATIMYDWDHLESRFVDHVIGAFMMIRFSTLEKTGFFDERFFMYLEDLDLSKRIADSGGKIYYNSEINIMHEGGGISKAVKGKRLFYSLRSRIIYCHKYRKEFNFILVLIISVLIEPLIRLTVSFMKFHIDEVKHTLGAYYLYYRWLILKK